MRTYTDEELVAYADGELPPEKAQAIAAAAAADPALARRVAEFSQTRQLLHEAFAPTLHEPVPQRLLDAVQHGPHPTAIALRPRPAASWRTYAPMALAASVACAIGLSLPGLRTDPATTPAVAGLPQNVGALSVALETQASGVPLGGGGQRGARYEVLPVSTLRLPDGRYCREFESSVSQPDSIHKARGVACRSPDGSWTPEVVATVADVAPGAAGDQYVPADGAGAGAELRELLGAAEPMTPAQEEALLAGRWSAASP